MEGSSLDGDSAPCSRQAWRLAAWMVILQPASDSNRIYMDFIVWECSGGRKFPGLRPGITRESWPY